MAVEDPDYPVKLPVTFAGIYGATLLAAMLGFFFYGLALLMCMQYFIYHASKDPIYMKFTIASLIMLATIHTAFSCHQAYDAFITKRGDLELLDEIVFSVPARWVTGYLVAFIAQFRIWSVGQRIAAKARYFAIPAILLAFTQLGAGLAQSIVMSESKRYSKLTLSTGFLIKTTAIQGSAAALSDIIISATLCYIFYSHRTTIRRTNSMINKLITYAIHRALATSLCAVAYVFLYYFCSGTYYFLIPMLAITHLYVISVVSVLTSREGLREQGEPSFHLTHLDMETATSDGVVQTSRDETSAHTTSVVRVEKEPYE